MNNLIGLLFAIATVVAVGLGIVKLVLFIFGGPS
jgi:hypothetical protein